MFVFCGIVMLKVFVKKVVVVLLGVLLLGACMVFDKERKILDSAGDVYFRLLSCINPQYWKDKAIIEPYFDAEWYIQHYGDAVKKSGLAPIDHYMQRGCRGHWKRHCDPNPWFKVTLYLDRLWPCSGDPFLDYLKQPVLSVPDNAEIVDVLANESEFERAWLAVEGLMRLNKYKVRLTIPKAYENKIPSCFATQIKRGLDIDFASQKISFYQSSFLRQPDRFGLTELQAKQGYKYVAQKSVMRVVLDGGHECHWHQMTASDWRKGVCVNPTVLNVGSYTDEAVLRFHMNDDDFKLYMKQISPVFDLMFVGLEIDVPQAKVVPGFMDTWHDEMPEEKEFSLSFLLSNDLSPREGETRLCKMRVDVFENEKQFAMPTRFCISRRKLDQFPKRLHDRALPTDSKIWVFKSMFNVASENTRQRNYFTEKLLGCFETLTVPLYIGCPNIGDYFDMRGMFIVNSIDELKKVVATLTPEVYQKMLPYVKKNREIARQFLTLKERLVNEFLNKVYGAS